jgi:CubicO group peptidase (beta-lactamase class C family)
MKFIKWFFIVIISLLVIGEAAILISGKTFLNRVFAMTIFSGKLGPDIDELTFFANREIGISKPQAWLVGSNYNAFKLDAELVKKIESYKTTSFLVIRNDSILYENYWENHHKESVTNSFSMAKSFTAALVGIAIKQGLIKSIDEPVGNYIESYKVGEKAKITIKHLLTMSSGIAFDETYNSPWAWPSEAYYGSDVNGLTLKSGVKMQPGITFEYKGGDTQLLGIILQQVLGKQSLSDYAAKNLWQPLGAEYAAFWSLDKENGMEKVSCCWYATARDFARIAKLYMQNGNWNGQQLLDSTYVAQSTTLAPLLKTNGEPNDQYGYQWWVMQYKDNNIFYCRGIRGQYIFAIPQKKIIIVRTGHKRGAKMPNDLPEDINVYLDAALSIR